LYFPKAVGRIGQLRVNSGYPAVPIAWQLDRRGPKLIVATLFVFGLVAGYFIGWYVAKRSTRMALAGTASRSGCSVKDLVLSTRRMVEIAESTIREKGTDVIYYAERK